MSLSLRTALWLRDGGACYVCREDIDFSKVPGTDDGPTIEHVVPLFMGGVDEFANMALSHGRCNWDRDYAEVGFEEAETMARDPRCAFASYAGEYVHRGRPLARAVVRRPHADVVREGSRPRVP